MSRVEVGAAPKGYLPPIGPPEKRAAACFDCDEPDFLALRTGTGPRWIANALACGLTSRVATKSAVTLCRQCLEREQEFGHAFDPARFESQPGCGHLNPPSSGCVGAARCSMQRQKRVQDQVPEEAFSPLFSTSAGQ